MFALQLPNVSRQVLGEDIQVLSEVLHDGVNLAVERFEVSHPNTAMTLRNIMQTLANMGI